MKKTSFCCIWLCVLIFSCYLNTPTHAFFGFLKSIATSIVFNVIGRIIPFGSISKAEPPRPSLPPPPDYTNLRNKLVTLSNELDDAIAGELNVLNSIPHILEEVQKRILEENVQDAFSEIDAIHDSVKSLLHLYLRATDSPLPTESAAIEAYNRKMDLFLESREALYDAVAETIHSSVRHMSRVQTDVLDAILAEARVNNRDMFTAYLALRFTIYRFSTSYQKACELFAFAKDAYPYLDDAITSTLTFLEPLKEWSNTYLKGPYVDVIEHFLAQEAEDGNTPLFYEQYRGLFFSSNPNYKFNGKTAEKDFTSARVIINRASTFSVENPVLEISLESTPTVKSSWILKLIGTNSFFNADKSFSYAHFFEITKGNYAYLASNFVVGYKAASAIDNSTFIGIPDESSIYGGIYQIRKWTNTTNMLDVHADDLVKVFYDWGQSWQRFRFVEKTCKGKKAFQFIGQGFDNTVGAVSSTTVNAVKGVSNPTEKQLWFVEPVMKDGKVGYTLQNCAYNTYFASPVSDAPATVYRLLTDPNSVYSIHQLVPKY